MAQSVRGKAAIVTGAGSGLNLALATGLLARGCHVLFADLCLRPEAEEIVQLHAQAESEQRGRAIFQKTDVTSWRQLEKMFETVESEFGGIDIVIAGAGVFEPDFSSFWIPPGSARSRDVVNGDRYAQIDINVVHPIRTTQLAIARALNSDGQRYPRTVLIVSSTNGQQASFATPVYAATKHAINGFVRSLAKLEDELNMRIVAVAPGIMRTPMYLENPDKLASIDMTKDLWASPEEVAEVMVGLIERDTISVETGDSSHGIYSILIAGGTILEVTRGNVRAVAPYNDPGPTGPGALASNIGCLVAKIKETLRKGWGAT